MERDNFVTAEKVKNAFLGLDTAVTGDVTYTAQFQAVGKNGRLLQYSVIFLIIFSIHHRTG